jgi:glycosyltransferase involved in cell wall biosynthesis
MNPLVSVIIPNYNHAQYLDVRIQSVLQQTYLNFEIIILDDKSSDNSLDIITKYKENPHVTNITVNSENSGSPFIQWNRGFKLAKGDLIWIAESDDDCSPKMLEKLVAEFENDAVLSFAFSRSLEMNENGEKQNVLQKMFPSDVHCDGKDFNRKFMIWGNKVFNASSVVFRRDFALSIDKQYMNYRGAGDWLFWIEMAEKGNVAVVSEPLNFYRLYDANTTNLMRLSGAEDLEDKKIYEYFKCNGYLSSIVDFRIHKKYICSIKYNNEYSNETIRQKSLDLWKPTFLLSLSAFISNLKWKYL